jgi:GNAT superfamily N-acetyltransferase
MAATAPPRDIDAKTPRLNLSLSTVDYARRAAELLAFRNANRENRRDPRYFSWRYAERPGRTTPIIVVAEQPGDGIVGTLSVIPHDYAVNGVLRSIGLLGDISVSQTWRGRGVATTMLRHLAQLPAFRELAAGLVLPNEEVSRPLAQCGWQTITHLDRYIRILDEVRFIRRRLDNPWLSRIIEPAAAFLLRAASADLPMGNAREYDEDEADSFDDRFDQLWARLPKAGVILGRRDAAHLTWRYARHPLTTHRVFTLSREGELFGYIVFHLADDICHIDDVLWLDERHGAALLGRFIAHVRRNPLPASVSIHVTGYGPAAALLRRCGFLRRRDRWHCMALPADGANPAIRSGWWLTAGDKDV